MIEVANGKSNRIARTKQLRTATTNWTITNWEINQEDNVWAPNYGVMGHLHTTALRE